MALRITADPIDAAALLAEVGSPADGAVLLFLGTVRDHNEGRRVRGMRYDAYAAMAVSVLEEIVSEARSRWPDASIAAVHRTGELALGEASVGVAVSTPHRAEAFDCGRHVLEEIKHRLPVWKLERYADGDEAWLDGVAPPVPERAHE